MCKKSFFANIFFKNGSNYVKLNENKKTVLSQRWPRDARYTGRAKKV